MPPPGRRAFLLALASSACACACDNGAAGSNVSKTTSPMTIDSSVPRLVAGLGDTLADVRQHSTFAFRTDLLSDSYVVAVDKPLQFVFRGPHPFDLAPTRFASLECTAAIVTAIQSSPHLDYLTRAAAMALLTQLNGRIVQAGWKADRDERPVPTGPELALGLRDPALPDDTWWFVAIYAINDARLFVKLRRTHRAGRNGPNDLFLVTLQWRDDVLIDRAIALARQLRQQDGLAPDLDRPIVLDTYVERVHALMPRTP